MDKDGVCDDWVTAEGLQEKYKAKCKGVDKCPKEPETVNSYQDEDGCPDAAVQVTDDALVILQAVNFVFNKSVIVKDSFPLLNEVAKVLKDYPRIKLVSVEGHTDLHGKPAPNMKLSDGRVKAVVKYLIKAGIDKNRLTGKAWGMTKPLISPEKTPEDAAKNRRVEFKILKQDPK